MLEVFNVLGLGSSKLSLSQNISHGSGHLLGSNGMAKCGASDTLKTKLVRFLGIKGILDMLNQEQFSGLFIYILRKIY